MLDDASRAAVMADIGAIADPFLRALLLDALWEEVRDARLAPLAYIDLALAQAPRETDALTVASLLGRTQTALRWYLSDAQRETTASRVEAAFGHGMTTAADKGLRVSWFRAYVGAATTAHARATLKALLAGTREVPDVSLSSRERFRIIERLLALGDPDADALLAAQSQADPGDDGRRYAYAVAAARPDAATKAKYFAAWFGDRALPESWIEESVAPFNTVEQAALTGPYLERALTRLPQLKRERKIFFVNHWLAAFLGGQTDAASVSATKRILRQAKLDPDLRRKVLESADELERTVRVRATFANPPAK